MNFDHTLTKLQVMNIRLSPRRPSPRRCGLRAALALLLWTGGAATAPAQTAGQDYKMAGPFEVVARDGAYRHTKGGSERDMNAALDLARAGHTARALAIVNAYATTLKRLDGHDAPLCAIQCFDLVRAMTLLRQWQQPAWRDMVLGAMAPMMRQFEADSPYANGNWGAIVNRLRMACAIFLGDSVMYREAKDYYLHAYDNGALPHYVSATGQCQETGRDQGHVQLGLEAMADICEMAWQQGDDLWGALDNRLMKGFEYTARYNLVEEVPFETWTDCTGLYCSWTEPGEMGRGKLWDIYRKPYDHYHGVRGLAMPYTERVLRGEKPRVRERPRLHSVTCYGAPAGAPLKDDYRVEVRPRGSERWTPVATYMAKVNALQPDGAHRVSEISYGLFDFTGDVYVRVTTRNRKFSEARVRPGYRGVIANVQNDSTVQFLLFQPENVSVEFDGDITSNLLLFTSRPCQPVKEARREARRQGRRFVYYAPGLYTADTIRMASNTTVYLAGGSYFTGTLAIDSAENVTVMGRGIARPARGYEGCHVFRSRNVVVDGLTVNTCPVGGSRGVRLHDVRSISHPAWGDGLNVFASEDVTFDRVFCRNSDDCTTAYATRKGFSGSVRNVRMTNSTLWADVAHPIFIGLHGNALRGDTIERLVYDNIDILGQAEPQVDYQGCLAINCGDNNTVRDVTFSNIRIEDICQGALVQVRVGFNKKYCAAPGHSVSGIRLSNIRYKGAHTPGLSIISGYDDGRKVSGVTFEGLKINGRTICDGMPGKPGWHATSDYVPMFVGPHVEGLEFRK